MNTDTLKLLRDIHSQLAVSPAWPASESICSRLSVAIMKGEDEGAALQTDLSNAMVLASEQDAALKAIKDHAEALGLALEDAISTCREDDKAVLVSAERREAWVHALADYRGSFSKPADI